MKLQPLQSNRQLQREKTLIGADGSALSQPLVQLGIVGLVLVSGYVALRVLTA